jgi:hypothetical protein
LTELEHSILVAVRRRRIATVQEIRQELNWPSDGIAIRAALLRLEERHCIVHSIDQGQFFYRHAGPLSGSNSPAGVSSRISQSGAAI